MLRLFGNFWVRALLLVLFAVGAYALVGFWLVPRVIRSQAIEYAKTEMGQQLTLGEIRSNPFTFELAISDIAIAEPREPLVALKHLYVDFQINSIWRRAWTFREVSLDGPFARAIVRPDGSLNLADLIPEKSDDGPLPKIWIENLRVSRGQLKFADQSRRLQPEKQLSPIEFELRDFHTTAVGGVFKLSAMSARGEKFDWTGHLSLQPIESYGQFKVSAIQARGVYEFLAEELPFELSEGRFDAHGNYRFSLGTDAGPQLEVTLPKASASNLGLRVPGGKTDWVNVPSLVLEDARMSLRGQAVSIASAAVSGLRADVWLNADGSTNLNQLFSGSATGTSLVPGETAAARQAESTRPAAERNWSFTLGHLQLKDGQIALEDRSVSPAARFSLAPISATADKVSLDMEAAIPVSMQTTINGQAALSLRGEVIPGTLGASLSVTLGKLPLGNLLSYLPMLPSLQLKSGTVEAVGELHLAAVGDQAPEIQFTGSAGIDELRLLQRSSQTELLHWRAMRLEGLDAKLGPDSVAIKRMSVSGLLANVEVAKDRSINLVSILGDSANSSAQASIALSRPAKASLAGKTPGPAAPRENGGSGPPPAVIDQIVLDDATLNFSDQSIEPNFSARIDALRGIIRNASTASDGVTSIDLEGHIINEYSPVSIKGETMPFAFDKHTDITMKFSNIELPIFNPYSGRYAGYAIAKGKLSTAIHYQIDKRNLTATHHVVLDQLEWGEATDSKEKVSLPVRLATSLLRDRHGVIDLDLPVSGTMDDPEFRIGPVVWQIVRNIVTKIVTAPFSFLGSLFQGAEDAQFIDFAAGSPALSASAKASLAALAKGLVDRPALEIDIPVGVAPGLDSDAIAQANFESAAAALKREQSTYASLSAEDKFDRLRDLYRQQFGEKPELPELADLAEDASRKEKKAARIEGSIAWLESQLKPRYQPDEATLTALGRARATAVQEALLSGGELDPARVFLAGDLASKARDGEAHMELGLK